MVRIRLKNPLYRGGKVSENQFRKIVRGFALDLPGAWIAEDHGISSNTVQSIYRKLRVFFVEAGLFPLADEGPEGSENFGDAPEAYSKGLAEFHRLRMLHKRGIRGSSLDKSYHLAESRWRLHYNYLQFKGVENFADLLEHDLLMVLELCGPLGGRPDNVDALPSIMQQQAEVRETARQNAESRLWREAYFRRMRKRTLE